MKNKKLSRALPPTSRNLERAPRRKNLVTYDATNGSDVHGCGEGERLIRGLNNFRYINVWTSS
jgi:hypothetical protein